MQVSLLKKDGTLMRWDYAGETRIPLLIRALKENEPDWDEINIRIKRKENE